ncbi:hypothetical protein BCR41DRAFT_33912 [Lobosporangium transversale]|uniref:Ubiquitin-like protease family profile domain-containing protein n=1 Tax=Lobosporangium transversale TaxID=64571 RepID=A0A1Y2GR78_9FUNG|nr:hypothetical protein BCR41DRAFT_33912 [Lobosporangium transversale]ORZ20026.1 hypothetical protein BCR41DRAFT_33912 [Lobosporangium transversale]|eukprot:XP_021882566.1 hypothetical protein BCR41DRAFT_33912 [Lobosporangium transversale]
MHCQYLRHIEAKRPSAAEEILAKKKRSPAPESIDSSEETLFIYPFNSSIKSKSIAVRAEDASRLNDGEFLNDTLIEFGLKYVQANAEVRNAALAGQVYIFNTFFYQRLVAKPSKGQANSYEAIKNWTAKIDLFSMKYIIVPINENLHWHLAIITNPGLLLRRANESESDVSLELVDGSGIDEGKSPPANSIVIGSDNEPTKNPKMPFINGSEKPYILCLNSLGGTHSAVFSVLRSYLQQVLLSRKGISMTLTSKEIAGKFSSKCPKQDNLSDCGVYLLHYAEVFLRNPETILDAIVNRTDDKDLCGRHQRQIK